MYVGTGSNGAGSLLSISIEDFLLFLDFGLGLDGPGSSSDISSSSSLSVGGNSPDLNHDLLFFFFASFSASDISVGDSALRLLSDRLLGIAMIGGAKP